jgi:catechol 2,3-dioxygenase-like lactoylglutathione lyase family enzyme
MKLYLEHANITVSDIDGTIKFLTTAFPHFKVRGKGKSETDGIIRQWLHLGTDETYVALEQVSSRDEGNRRPYKDIGINHLGFVVEDVETIVANLKKAGYRESIEVEPHPFRKRFYFYDPDNTEYEFIEYLSDDFAERNEYD